MGLRNVPLSYLCAVALQIFREKGIVCKANRLSVCPEGVDHISAGIFHMPAVDVVSHYQRDKAVRLNLSRSIHDIKTIIPGSDPYADPGVSRVLD